MMRGRPAIIIFARAPVPGQTKTRLIPALGRERAAEIYRCFLLDTLRQAADLPAHIVVAAAAPDDVGPVTALVEEACPGADVALQVGADLGQRMAGAFDQAFAHAHPSVAIIGSDAPTLPFDRVRRALSLLDGPSEVVLGPCFDGGYYLVGLRAPIPQLFARMEWGAPTVLADTLRQARAVGAKVSLLDPWYDVDTPDDLETLRSHLTALFLAGDAVPCPATWRYLQECLSER